VDEILRLVAHRSIELENKTILLRIILIRIDLDLHQ
jgi:hypothetical protein